MISDAAEPIDWPQDTDVENLFLCACLADNGKELSRILLEIPDATRLLFDKRNRLILSTAAEVGGEFIALSTALDAKGGCSLADQRAYISGVLNLNVGADTANYYAEKLRPLAVRRQLIEGAVKLGQAARDGDAGAIAEAQKIIAEVTPATATPNKRRLSFRNPAEIVAMEFSESGKILDDWLFAKGQGFALLGEAGIGKSALVVYLAACCVTSRAFFTLDTYSSELKWLFIQTENSNRRLQKDLERLRAWLGESDWQLFCERVRFHTIENDEDGFLCVDDAESMADIEEEIKTYQPGIVVFDPLADVGSGDLNTDEAMKHTLRVLARTVKKGNSDRAIMVLHHALTGRAGASRAIGYDRTSFGRNSKAPVAWARGQINIAPGSPDPADGLLVIPCGKCSNGKPFDRFAVKLNPNTMIYEVYSEFNWDQWEKSLAATPNQRHRDLKLVANLCCVPISRADLAKKIGLEWSIQTTNSYRYIKKAVEAKKIKLDKTGKNYVRT